MQKSRRSLTRTLGWGLLGGIVLLLSGDRGVRTAGTPGQDPLDVLNLQVRANAIIVVDTSGSMGESLGSGDLGGDAAAAKLYKAKQVLKTVIQENERKVSFQFGQYKQPGVGSGSNRGSCSVTTTTTCLVNGDCPGGETCVTGPMRVPLTGFGRFLYTTSSDRDASMASNELIVDLRSYNVPAGQRIRMNENGANVTDSASCQVAPGIYQTAFDFANAVATAMSNCGGNAGSPQSNNTYTVTVDQNNSHRFRFQRATGTLSWGIRWSQMTTTYNTLRNFLTGGLGTDSANFTTAAYVPASTPTTGIDLKRDATVDATNYTGGKFTETLTAATFTHYRLFARRFYNGQTVRVRPDGVACTVTPVPGTTGVGGDGSAAGQEAWIDIQRGDAACAAFAPAQVVRFFFSSVPRSGNFLGNANADGEWRAWTGNGTCGGFESLVPLAPCTQNAQFNLISPFLANEVILNAATRWPVNYTEDAVGNITSQPAVGGMRAAGNTPIAQSLVDIDTVWESSLWPTISGYSANGPFPKTFVVFVTDGDDTCESPTGGNSITNDPAPGLTLDDKKALRAAHRAQLLYQSVDTSTQVRAIASSVTTFVVAFGVGASGTRSDWIAYGGSGMGNAPFAAMPTFNHGGTIGLRWANPPTQAQIDACTTCRKAFLAGDEDDLGRALQIAIDQGQSVGTFSDQQSVTDSIFELSYLVGFDPRNPQTRYRSSVPVLLQSTFAMPDFNGRLRAFRRQGASSLLVWDAGQKLRDRIVNGASGTGTGMGALNWSYGELRGTGTDVNMIAGNARIKRRIYTSNGNGVFLPTQDNLLNGTGPGRLTLWPADPTIDPAGTGGIFDDEMGIQLGMQVRDAPPPAPLVTVTFAYLQTKYGACTSFDPPLPAPSNLPANCTAATPARAVMEARRIILASMAGADLVKSGNLAVRRAADKELLFRAKAWPLAESTLAAPAVVGPPPTEPPGRHTLEYDLFATGPRVNGVSDNMISSGFGLRDPDKDTLIDANDPRQSLKPVMSVAYHAANDMLHAFRAGPCFPNLTGSTCLDGTSEAGGEELWGFVPFDLLGNLRKLVVPQTRADHTFMLASPIRFSQVFVPGTWSRTGPGGAAVSGEGLWRNVMLFGRGTAGKSYTALDVTAPGPYTQGSLSTTGPILRWNRGNPDTRDGLPTGTVNNNAADATAYADMGETWSVPAVAFVDPTRNVTPRSGSTGIEFVAYTGSGYSDVATEGKRYYALDFLTGDVIASAVVANRPGPLAPPFENSIVAGPVSFNQDSLSDRDTVVNPAESFSTRVYFDDIHGRLYRVMTDDPGTVVELADVNGNSTSVIHPLGVPPALLFYGDANAQEYPHIYVESGNDSRIFSPEATPPTTPPFKAWGLVDRDLVSDPDGGDGVNGPIQVLFTKFFPDLFRGTAQPATAFTEDDLGRVFFVGTRFNPPGTPFAPPPPPCRSSFDSVLFALGAGTGNAAYDLNGTGQDEYITYTGEQLKSVQTVGGQVIVDRGLNTALPMPPPPDTIAPPIEGSVFQGLSIDPRFVVSHRESPFSGASAVCR